MIRYLLLFPVAWVTNVVVYVGALFLFYGETISRGDLLSVLFWFSVANLILIPALYLPCVVGLYWILDGWQPFVVFPVAMIPLAVVPTGMIVSAFGGGMDTLFSSEALLFHVSFGAGGVVVGAGAAWRNGGESGSDW